MTCACWVTGESPESNTARYACIEYLLLTRKSSLEGVQRLFSMFPPGWPGLALLSLRLSVAVALLLDLHDVRPLGGWIYAAAMLLAVSLGAGLLTPIGACLALTAHVVIWSTVDIRNPGLAAIVTFDALALALLGPGAYSIDAYRFGRRVVVLPPP
jgi:hypothetical protein